MSAASSWAEEQVDRRRDVVRVGYFGSYARGDWGVGSDLDLVIVVNDSGEPFERRGAGFDVLDLPVPAEVLVYTEEEWRRLQVEGGRFGLTLAAEVVWLVEPVSSDAERPSFG